MGKELSIFIDESGDLGNYQNHSPFYIISLVFMNKIIILTTQSKNLIII